uniref:Class I SAM-dependent methyltransferase n=1 Tax=candidate division WOR-3 bacterium TaxID=2052148 RepID=A0A7C3J6T3_UNCW3
MKRFFNRVYKKIEKETLPKKLKENFRNVDEEKLEKFKRLLEEEFFKGWRGKDNFSKKVFENDLKTQLYLRLFENRYHYIPWINKTVKLKNSNILEIGCGTGSSTVALTEQGAFVTGIDIDESSLNIAKERMKIYGLEADFLSGNCLELFEKVKEKKFDVIIFYASLEHMLYEERIESIKKYFSILSNGSFLIVVETPNRLWYFDEHTSLLPFFNWLPDRLAFDYTKFSERSNFRELYKEFSDEKFLHFLRRGRGLSFHEFEIALNSKVEKIKVVSYLKQFLVPFSVERRYLNVLRSIYPKISEGFFYPFLNLIIKKQ